MFFRQNVNWVQCKVLAWKNASLLRASCGSCWCCSMLFYVWPCAFFFLGFLNFTMMDIVTDIHLVSAHGTYFNLVASVGNERSEFEQFVQNTSSVGVRKIWDSEEKFEDDYKKETYAWPAIVIEKWEPPQYKIRLPYNSLKSASTNPTEEVSHELVVFDANHTEWYYNHFVPLQLLVDDFFIGKQNSTTILKTQRLRIPDYHYKSIDGLISNLEWCLLIAFFCYTAVISALFVAESDGERLKPFLEAIGINKITYFASWMLYFLIATSPMIGTIFFSFIFFDSTTAGVQLTIVAILFGLALMLWTILAFTLFPGPLAFGSMLLSWIAITIPLILFDVTKASPAVQYVASLIPHVNLFCATKKALNGHLVLGHIFIFLLSMIILCFLTIYFDLVIPKKGKDVAHPCFCFLSENAKVHFDYIADHVPEIEEIDHGEQLEIGINIENLHKHYNSDNVWSRLRCDAGNQVHAVRNVSLDIYNNQVFVLIGHNGAGKTSFCNVLNGRNTPTWGKVLINGLDIVSNREEINCTQGICPQKEVLWGNLTLLQHLQIHSKLKSAPISDIKNILKEFNLSKKKNTKAKDLSGGEKRKLSVAIAFLGNPRIVYLDEPTCSMDPVSQRQVWNLIAKKKKGRVIILTTHFMQEAEVLGDRIGMLRDGVLQICGSAMFLKSKCGVGYTLRIFGQGGEEISQKLEDAHDFLTPVGNLEYTASFSDSHNFPHFFKQLEEIHEDGFSLEVTSLEEVFSKVSKINMEPKEIDSAIFQSNDIPLSMQVWVMIKQKFYSKSKWLIIYKPIFVVLYCAFLFNLFFDVTEGYDALPISLEAYDNITIPIVQESNFTATLSHSTIQIEATQYNFAEEIFKLHDDYLIYGGYYDESIILYNTTSMHSLPAFVNALNSFFFQRAWNTSNATISVANHPLPLRNKFMSLMQDSEAVMMILMVVLCVKNTLMRYTVQMWRERVTTQFKSMLLRMGATHEAYWLASLIYYYATFCGMVLVMIFSAMIFKVDTIFRQQPTIIPLILIAGPALILSWFLTSFYHKEIGTFMISLQFTTIATYIGIGILYLMQDSLFLYILYLIPDLAFFDGVIKIVIAHVHDEDPEGLVPIFFFLIFDAFFWFYRILEKEHCQQNPNIHSFCSCKSSDSTNTVVVEEQFDEDEDVIERRREILTSSVDPTEICFANARKVYPGEPATKCCCCEVEAAKDPVVAVSNVSFRAREGQTFALLGPNGAGKTSLLKTLIGKHALTSGTATVNGRDVGREQEDIRKSLGYCDQGSSLSESLTGMQHLEIAMGLRGISDTTALTDIISSEFQLTQHLKKKVENFSGGTKRKLESALSLIGLPSFLILDEPTTGVDTFARKSIYELIQKTKDGRTFLLTTHSMEEAEFLAHEICIMVNGRMRCIGTASHLKQRFAQGYGSEINPLGGKYEEVKDAILCRFPDAEIVKSDEFKLRFRFPESSAWELFQFFEEDLKDLIKDYLVGSTTLEQVFMTLAKLQIERNEDGTGGGETPMEITVIDETSKQNCLGNAAGSPRPLELIMEE